MTIEVLPPSIVRHKEEPPYFVASSSGMNT